VADINDGLPDVMVVNVVSNSVSFLQGNGDGTLQPPVFCRLCTRSRRLYSVAVADLMAMASRRW
jgi:hypothetical protein